MFINIYTKQKNKSEMNNSVMNYQLKHYAYYTRFSGIHFLRIKNASEQRIFWNTVFYILDTD